MAAPTKEELAKMPEYVLRYFAPMMGCGKPYAEELIRRMKESENGHQAQV